MPHYICVTCGVQYAESEHPPEHCLICEDERQYIGWNGQQWTTLEQLREGRHNVISEVEPGLYSIKTEPGFSIGQMPHLIQTPHGNVLWDCISTIDDATVQRINELGGIKAMAISHPHFYDTMVEWSRAFGGAPIYLPSADRQWVMRPDPVIQFYDEPALELVPGVTVIRCGGHFDGSAVLHWAAGAGGKGALFTSDTIMVTMDRRFVTFMYSYPNDLPLPPAKVRRIVEAVKPYAFDRIYGAWTGKVVQEDAKNAVRRSAERYIRLLEGAAVVM